MTRDELLAAFPAHRGKLLATLARLVCKEDAEDLAAETLMRAMEAIEDFRGDAALATWLHRVSVNLALDLLRQRGRHAVSSLDADEVFPELAEVAGEASVVEQRQMSECVRGLMTRLPPEQRHVLIQADMLDRTAPEIARDGGLTPGNVKIRLHRARRAMQEVLETHCEFDRDALGVRCCVPKSDA